jgi:hypothetical protein
VTINRKESKRSGKPAGDKILTVKQEDKEQLLLTIKGEMF